MTTYAPPRPTQLVDQETAALETGVNDLIFDAVPWLDHRTHESLRPVRLARHGAHLAFEHNGESRS